MRFDKDKQSKFMIEGSQKKQVGLLLPQVEVDRDEVVERVGSFERQAKSQKNLERSPRPPNMDLSMELDASGNQAQHFIPQVGQEQTRESSPTR